MCRKIQICFCPATFAQFYLDHNPPFPNTGGRLSVSKDSDAYPAGGNGHQNRHNKSNKQDAEELEAYRASFGSVLMRYHYYSIVEISDVTEDSFSMTPFTPTKPTMEESVEASSPDEGQKAHANYEDPKSRRQPGNVYGSNTPGNHAVTDDDISQRCFIQN
uniref:Uncharacterized protein n=1 Tax=Salix viminalis TaxID=40686 RepID=A0A6N2NG44_SALVM